MGITQHPSFCSLCETPDIEERPVASKLTGFEIHEDEVLKRLVALNPNKSCGPDGFHPRLLKEFAAVLAGTCHYSF
jgi:hypothetical protein